MKKILVLLLFIAILFQAKAQNTEVEIYLVQSNSIVKGTIEANTSDFLRVRVDSLHTLSFAKTELEGRELPMSKEIKTLRKSLIKSESSKIFNSFPGIYQMQHGEKPKGKIMLVLTCIGLVGVLVSGGVYLVGFATLKGLEFIACVGKAFLIFAPSAAVALVTFNWSLFDKLQQVKKTVNNRYYYRGNINFTDLVCNVTR